MKDHVEFDEVIDISDELLAPNLRHGDTSKYRLFSVVEHLGQHASRGHYVCYTLDSDDLWQCFDDDKVKRRDLDLIIESTTAYILFYELIL